MKDTVARARKAEEIVKTVITTKKSDSTAHASSPLRVELTADLARYIAQPTVTWEFEEVW